MTPEREKEIREFLANGSHGHPDTWYEDYKMFLAEIHRLREYWKLHDEAWVDNQRERDQLKAENEKWEQLHPACCEILNKNLNENNKPLGLAAAFALLVSERDHWKSACEGRRKEHDVHLEEKLHLREKLAVAETALMSAKEALIDEDYRSDVGPLKRVKRALSKIRGENADT